MELLVAVTFVLPTASALARPAELTVATDVFEELPSDSGSDIRCGTVTISTGGGELVSRAFADR